MNQVEQQLPKNGIYEPVYGKKFFARPRPSYAQARYVNWPERILLVVMLVFSAGLVTMFFTAVGWLTWNLMQRVFGS